MQMAVAVNRMCSIKKVFLKFRKIDSRTTVPRSLFWQNCYLRPVALLKKRPWHRSLPVNFVKILRTPFFIEHLLWLVLELLVLHVTFSLLSLFFFSRKLWGFFFLQMLQKTFKSKEKWREEINGHARQMKF